MTKKEEKPKEAVKCSFMDCNRDAVCKGIATKESIAKLSPDDTRNKHLFEEGTWYYCDYHRTLVSGYCLHLEFGPL